MPKIELYDVADNKKDKYTKYLLNHPYFCKSFKIIIVGKSGSGKTQILYNILFGKSFMLDLWKKTKGSINCFIPTMDTCEELAKMAKKSKFKPKNFKIHNQWNEEACEKEYSILNEKEPNLFIFDDVSFLKNFSRPQTRNIIDEICCAGRHKNAYAIVLAQKYTHLNENLRANNCTCLIIMFGLIAKEIERIYSENFSTIMDINKYNKIIKKHLSEQYNFIVFDKKHNKIYDNEFNIINIE